MTRALNLFDGSSMDGEKKESAPKHKQALRRQLTGASKEEDLLCLLGRCDEVF
jgi:hypothetical protein